MGNFPIIFKAADFVVNGAIFCDIGMTFIDESFDHFNLFGDMAGCGGFYGVVETYLRQGTILVKPFSSMFSKLDKGDFVSLRASNCFIIYIG